MKEERSLTRAFNKCLELMVADDMSAEEAAARYPERRDELLQLLAVVEGADNMDEGARQARRRILYVGVSRYVATLGVVALLMGGSVLSAVAAASSTPGGLRLGRVAHRKTTSSTEASITPTSSLEGMLPTYSYSQTPGATITVNPEATGAASGSVTVNPYVYPSSATTTSSSGSTSGGSSSSGSSGSSSSGSSSGSSGSSGSSSKPKKAAPKLPFGSGTGDENVN